MIILLLFNIGKHNKDNDLLCHIVSSVSLAGKHPEYRNWEIFESYLFKISSKTIMWIHNK